MELSKAQLLLDKINRLYKSMSLDPENVAQIEKDLMRDYIKMLYESFTDETPVKKGPIVRKASPPVEPTEPLTTNVYETQVTRSRAAQDRIIAPPPVTKRVIPPPVEEVVVATPPPVVTPQPRQVSPNPTPSFDADGAQLFTEENGTELSHKLSSLPISDLNKAMGINERIFTINELFRGDSRAFKHTMAELNQLATFEDAKMYLAKNIVNLYDWTEKSRRNKAKKFIKLIRRRYI